MMNKQQMIFLGSITIILVIFNYHPKAVGQLLTEFNLPRLSSEQILEQLKIRQLKENLVNPLILTPYIEAGQQVLARKLSRVNEELFLNVTSYSGYLTVDKNNNGNLFFWFFPAEGTEHLYDDDDNSYGYDGEDEDTDYDHPFLKKLQKSKKKEENQKFSSYSNEQLRLENNNKPIVLWLQGGPGASSLYGLFTENGPFIVNDDDSKTIRENPYSWHKNYSIIFVDNPVGTGFSFTNSNGYVKNMTQVGQHMYRFLSQFFDLFSILKNNDFFITGESFAGKYIPAIGNEIYEQNKLCYDKDKKINLKGLALGDAFSDPYNMIDYADYAYQLGLVEIQGYEEMKINEYLLRMNYDNLTLAKSYWDKILSTFSNYSSYANLYNIAQPQESDLVGFFDFINQPKIRNAIHVGSQEFHGTTQVYNNLIPDFFKTAMHWTEELLNNGLRIFYYNGNWDFIVAYPLSENAFHKMKWNGIDKYRTAERKPFFVNGTLKGYIKKADNFAEAVFLNAGHMVPADQPIACLTVLDRFFKDQL